MQESCGSLAKHGQVSLANDVAEQEDDTYSDGLAASKSQFCGTQGAPAISKDPQDQAEIAVSKYLKASMVVADCVEM